MIKIKEAILDWLYEHSVGELGGGRFISSKEFEKMVKELEAQDKQDERD